MRPSIWMGHCKMLVDSCQKNTLIYLTLSQKKSFMVILWGSPPSLERLDTRLGSDRVSHQRLGLGRAEPFSVTHSLTFWTWKVNHTKTLSALLWTFSIKGYKTKRYCAFDTCINFFRPFFIGKCKKLGLIVNFWLSKLLLSLWTQVSLFHKEVMQCAHKTCHTVVSFNNRNKITLGDENSDLFTYSGTNN